MAISKKTTQLNRLHINYLEKLPRIYLFFHDFPIIIPPID